MKKKTQKKTKAAHLVCPTCNGSGHIPKESMKVTRYHWREKGAKKVNHGGNLMTSFLTISTISAPNGPRKPKKKARR